MPSASTSGVRLPMRRKGKCSQRQRAAFAVIVGAQQEQHVFERDDDNQGPEDQRQHAEHGRLRDDAVRSAGGQNGFAQRVERARADVAIDDADRAEGERPERAAGQGRIRRPMAVTGSIAVTVGIGRF